METTERTAKTTVSNRCEAEADCHPHHKHNHNHACNITISLKVKGENKVKRQNKTEATHCVFGLSQFGYQILESVVLRVSNKTGYPYMIYPQVKHIYFNFKFN